MTDYSPPGASPPPKKRAGKVGVVLGCAALGLILVLAVAGGALAWLVLASGGGGSPFKASTAETIKYGPVKDSKTGPSRVKPSGRSAKTLKTRGGVIESWAQEAEGREQLSLKGPSSCEDTEHATDALKGLIFNVDRQMRKQSDMSPKEEMRLGRKLAAQIDKHPKFAGKVDTPGTRRWRAYLARVAQPLLAEVERESITYKFHVIDLPVVNAFAIPGGHIYFFTGMLENRGGTWLANEAQLAGILAHEISHVDLGHTAAVFQYLKQFGLSADDKLATIAVALARHPFSSNQEDEADANAVELMTLAQYSPEEFVRMWRTWGKNFSKVKKGRKKGPGLPSGNPVAKELANLLRSHSTPKKRACNSAATGRKVLEELKFDRFYVGRSNLRGKKPRTQKQY